MLLCAFNSLAQVQWTMTNIAGNGNDVYAAGNDALETGFQAPAALAMDNQGNIYFAVPAFAGANGIYKIDHSTNELSLVLTDIPGISGLAIHPTTNVLYFSRGNLGPSTFSYFHIYAVDLTDYSYSVFAGNGFAGIPVEGALALDSPIGGAGGIEFDKNGDFLYYTSSVIDDKHFIQRIDMSNLTTHRVLGKIDGIITGEENVDDESIALDVQLILDLGLAFDSEGDLYFPTRANQIKKIVDGKIYNVAGNGEEGSGGDGGLATAAQLSLNVNGLAINNENYLFFGENGNRDIRRVKLFPTTEDPEIITRLCGTGYSEGDAANPSGDLVNGVYKLAIEANIDPVDILLDGEDIIFSDQGKNRLRRATFCKYPEIMSTTINPISICKGDTVDLSFIGSLGEAEGWKWYKDECFEGDILSNSTNYSFIATENASYYFAGVGGCIADSSCTEIKVEFSCKEYFNTFTPNNDGKNDFFEITIVENFPINTVVIYNRWGDVLETIENYDNSSAVWQGTNGYNDPVDAGTYYFTFVSNGELISSGWIELIR